MNIKKVEFELRMRGFIIFQIHCTLLLPCLEEQLDRTTKCLA